MHAKPLAATALNPEVVSFILELECSGCGSKYSHEEIHTFCPICQSPLLVRYDLKAVRKHVDRDAFRCRPGRMWRWHELLPVKDPEILFFLGKVTPLYCTFQVWEKNLDVPTFLSRMKAQIRPAHSKHGDLLRRYPKRKN